MSINFVIKSLHHFRLCGQQSRCKIFTLILSVIVLECGHTVFAYEACVTPARRTGTCIPITSCRPLLQLRDNPYREPSQTRLLRNSICHTGMQDGVCCPDDAVQNNCRTPAGEDGTCIPLVQCPYLKRIEENYNSSLSDIVSNKTRDFLVQSLCYSDSVSLKFCCKDVTEILPENDKCGRQEYDQPRIFSGKEASIYEYPWMAILLYGQKAEFRCGGSLISRNFVLTAAHCVTRDDLFYVRLGDHNTSSVIDCVQVDITKRKQCNDEYKDIRVERVISHPEYCPYSKKNDIALVKLQEDAPYTDFIRPICLPSYDITNKNVDVLTVVGWGLTENKNYSEVKLYVDVPISDCVNVPGSANWEKQVCAGGVRNRDSCNGDSGGPLMKTEKAIWFVHGVVSYGSAHCGTEGVPGVYTKVFSYVSWIKQTLNL